MTATFPSDDIDAAVRHDAALIWGRALFGCFGFICMVSTGFLYLLVANTAIRDSRFWIAGLFCAPSCLLSCIGFIQIVSGTTCNRFLQSWRSLKLWRRVLIV